MTKNDTRYLIRLIERLIQEDLISIGKPDQSRDEEVNQKIKLIKNMVRDEIRSKAQI
jgi:hypothetical protein